MRKKWLLSSTILVALFGCSERLVESKQPQLRSENDERFAMASAYVESNGIPRPWTVSKLIQGFKAAEFEEAKHHFIYLLVHTRDPVALHFLGENLIPKNNPYRAQYHEKLKEYNDYDTRYFQRLYVVGLAMEAYVYGPKPWRDGGPVPHVVQWWEENQDQLKAEVEKSQSHAIEQGAPAEADKPRR